VTYEQELARYTLRRNPAGSWLYGNRWEALRDGRPLKLDWQPWIYPHEYESSITSATRFLFRRRVRRYVRTSTENYGAVERVDDLKIPMQDLRRKA